MAKIVESNIVIKVSTLVKDSADITNPVTQEVLLALEQVTQELLGTDFVVEAEKA